MEQLFTVRYGGRAPSEFAELLVQHGVRTVVDVRLRPDRVSMGVYVRARGPEKGLQRLLSEAGLEYVALVELGTLSNDYDDWRERCAPLLERMGPFLCERQLVLSGPLCLLCAEKRVSECHRQQIADCLAAAHGYQIHHME